jgi:hypothetical protein
VFGSSDLKNPVSIYDYLAEDQISCEKLRSFLQEFYSLPFEVENKQVEIKFARLGSCVKKD